MFFDLEDISIFHRVSFNFIKVQREAHVFTLTLARSEKRNAFTPTMIHEIAFALAYAESEKDIWCIVINAEGPVFCAGMDLKVFQNPSLDIFNIHLPKPIKEINLGDAFRYLTKPTLAKVEGSVFAGGFLILCGCTFVLALEHAEFSLPEVKRGLFPMQVISSLLQIMSYKKALQLCLLADTYSSREAKEMGLITTLCSPQSIQEELDKLIKKLCSHAPLAMSKGFETFKKLSSIPEEDRFSYMAKQLDELRNSIDAEEGIKAFQEKREPIWKNE